MNRAHRLTSSRDVRRVLRHGTRISSGTVTCVIDCTDRTGPARVAFNVTRRAGGAVQRNRARRRLREAVRAHLEVLPPGADAVVLGRADAGERNWKELVTDVRAALSRAAEAC